MRRIGDRLYFMEVLTQLHDAVNSWSKMLGQSLSSTRTLPNLQRNGLPLQVVSWNTKEVLIWIEALGLAEWKPVFEKHRIQVRVRVRVGVRVSVRVSVSTLTLTLTLTLTVRRAT